MIPFLFFQLCVAVIMFHYSFSFILQNLCRPHDINLGKHDQFKYFDSTQFIFHTVTRELNKKMRLFSPILIIVFKGLAINKFQMHCIYNTLFHYFNFIQSIALKCSHKKLIHTKINVKCHLRNQQLIYF